MMNDEAPEIMLTIDLNCDLGEDESPAGKQTDSALLPFVTSINIACGGHAGSETRIEELIREAMPSGIGIGAHPGYADRATFGRTALKLSPLELIESLSQQISLVAGIARRLGTSLQHVKPHGALYHQASTDFGTADCVIQAIQQASPLTAVMGMAGCVLLTMAAAEGLQILTEGFADRRYQADGTLVPRTQPNAVITDLHEAAQQAFCLTSGGSVQTVEGTPLVVPCETICIHSDSPGAVDTARAIRSLLNQQGIRLRPPIPQR